MTIPAFNGSAFSGSAFDAPVADARPSAFRSPGVQTQNAHAWNTRAQMPSPVSGTHLPFTAPLLAGVRARRKENNLEFILPNPSGGRGTYVVSWTQIAELASPTLHDTILAKRLHEMPLLNPLAVRGMARAVAAEGYAGRSAAQAALRAQARHEGESLRLWANLLMALIQQTNLPVRDPARVLAGLGAAGPGVVTSGFTAAALRIGWKSAALAEALDRLSEAYLPIVADGRAGRLLSLMTAMHPALLAEQAHYAPDVAASSAHLTRTSASIGQWLGRARASFENAARVLADPLGLLARWQTDAAGALDAARSAEEVLDGWDRICLLWLDAQTPSVRLRLLPEIGLLVRLACAASEADATVLAARHGSPGEQRTHPEAIHDTGQPLRPAPQTSAASASGGVERNERIRTRELALEHSGG